MNKTKYNREKTIDSLNKKGAKLPCHRCGHQSFTVIDGFSKYHLSNELEANVIGGQGVPVVLVACNNCGAITPHAAFALIEREEVEQKEEGGENVK